MMQVILETYLMKVILETSKKTKGPKQI
jgi:hypothetical protein